MNEDPKKPMNVAELIAFLQTQDPAAKVCVKTWNAYDDAVETFELSASAFYPATGASLGIADGLGPDAVIEGPVLMLQTH